MTKVTFRLNLIKEILRLLAGFPWMDLQIFSNSLEQNNNASAIFSRPILPTFIHSLKLYKISDKTLLSNVSTIESNIAA